MVVGDLRIPPDLVTAVYPVGCRTVTFLCPYLVVVRPDCRLIVKPPRFSLPNNKRFAVAAILRNPLPYHDRPTCREILCDAEFCQRLALSVAP